MPENILPALNGQLDLRVAYTYDRTQVNPGNYWNEYPDQYRLLSGLEIFGQCYKPTTPLRC